MTKLDSEFTCEVVEVVEVLKHDNADKLEVARFKFVDGTIPEYQVVVAKGDFKPGSWGVYISADSLVPVAFPQFEFLKKRLDYINGSLTYRVKGAKIRGVLSTGMMLHFQELPTDIRRNAGPGTDLSEQLGVLKYVRPEDVEVEIIPNSTGTERRWGNALRKWWNRFTLGNSISVPDYSVVSLRKAPKLFEDGETVYVTEKVHGSNIRFGRVNGQPLVGSHHVIKTDNRPFWKRMLWKKRGSKGSWYGKDVFTEWFHSVFPGKREWDELPNNIVFYGELYGSGIQKLTYGTKHPKVVVFDAWDMSNKRWLSKYEIDDMLPFTLGRPPQLHFGDFKLDTIKQLAEGPSHLALLQGDKHIREGVVVRSLDWQRRGKWVGEGYYLIKE